MRVDFGPNIQMAFVVPDLDVAIEQWLRVQGVGPFHVMRHCAVSNAVYRGTRPVEVDFGVAIAQMGGVQVELIEQYCDTPSAYRDVYARGEGGFHHTCVVVPDIEGAIAHYAAQGAPVAIRGDFGAVRWAYIDTRPQLGCMTELVGEHPDIRAFFQSIADSAVDWDGSNPVRNL